MNPKSGNVYWVTGLSGSGKTTLCRRLVERLRGRGHSVVMLDGDELRAAMGAGSAHTRDERLSLAMRYARLCHMIAEQGIDVAIATISLFREVHEWNRKNMPGYIEIYLAVPLSELKRRDPKDIYARADRGELQDIAGLDLAVDEPQAPDLCIKWSPELTEEQTLNMVFEKLKLESPDEN